MLLIHSHVNASVFQKTLNSSHVFLDETLNSIETEAWTGIGNGIGNGNGNGSATGTSIPLS